jgi:exodeoxyribonuclease VII large subunit
VEATKGWVEKLGAVWVTAQIIELKRRTGHMQFLTLRDATEEVSVTATTTTRVLDVAGPVTEGATVVALLKPTVWKKSGRLAFNCTDLRIAGEGQLLAQLEQRKRMLQAEGLFAPELKKPIPFLPNCIGLITGQKSDAERDVVQNARLRWPNVRFRIEYSLVQGLQAAGQVIAKLAELDADPEVDVIVIARGGGALEDLLPFSDEALVRAVFAARTPVVSAIGHERDNPILDLVADLRASTPTDAAKRIVPDVAELGEENAYLRGRLRAAVLAKLKREQAYITDVRSRPVLRDPAGPIRLHVERLTVLRGRLRTAIRQPMLAERDRVSALRQRARALSPEATLTRGYSIVSVGGRTLASVKNVEIGDAASIRLRDGELGVSVESVNANTRSGE